MTYLSGKAEQRKKFNRYIIYIGFLVVALFFWGTVRGFVYPIFQPFVIQYGALKQSLINIPEFFSTYTTSRTSLIEKNKNLEITLENLENEVAEKDAQLKELKLVTSDMGDNSLSSTLVLYPLMNDITRLYSTILFSKGYKDGVEKDAYVYVRGLQPVCIIREVYALTSLCELLSSGNVTTEAVIVSASSTRINVTLIGRGGGAFLGNVVRDTPIVVGDKVFLKSDQAMSLGTVVSIINNNQDTSWRVFVAGEYNPVTSSIFYMHKK